MPGILLQLANDAVAVPVRVRAERLLALPIIDP
jgi:hypothetical protein